MNLKKILLGIGLIIFGYVTTWGVMTTYNNFNLSNALVSAAFLAIELFIFYLFVKA